MDKYNQRKQRRVRSQNIPPNECTIPNKPAGSPTFYQMLQTGTARGNGHCGGMVGYHYKKASLGKAYSPVTLIATVL
eukprot:scaffold13160_cov81-Phaeocystis_antarctica.AAC.6